MINYVESRTEVFKASVSINKVANFLQESSTKLEKFADFTINHNLSLTKTKVDQESNYNQFENQLISVQVFWEFNFETILLSKKTDSSK